MKKPSTDFAFLVIIFLSISAFFLWGVNIYKLIFVDSSIGLLVARAIGIFVAPLGVVLGLF